jgi:CheY-like chemotaxis protein
VVEDVDSSRKILIHLLERSGHSCVPASNGEEAIRKIAKDMADAVSPDNNNNNNEHVPIDTILLDYEMPVLNGPDAAANIRQIGFKGIIFGVTGNVASDDVEFFKSNGADDVLGKPISMAALNRQWEQHCRSREQQSNKRPSVVNTTAGTSSRPAPFF